MEGAKSVLGRLLILGRGSSASFARILVDADLGLAVEPVANFAQPLDHLIDLPVGRGRASGNTDTIDADQLGGVDLTISFDQEAALALFFTNGQQFDAV